jgi:hypothetical protein
MDIETLNISILPFPFFSPIQNQGFEDFLMYYVIKAELVVEPFLITIEN